MSHEHIPATVSAFPLYVPGRSGEDDLLFEGMSLRDYFAGCALSGLMASDEYSTNDEGSIARMAYDQADWMLSQRQKEAKP